MKSLNFLNLDELSLNTERHDVYTLSRVKVNVLDLDKDKVFPKNDLPYSRFIKVLTKEGENIYLDTIDKRLYLKYLRFERNIEHATKQ